jgi:integrase
LVYDAAKISPRGFHRIRDEFACDYLDKGGDMEMLARYLGHSTSATTRAHYNPWYKNRQKALDADMQRHHIASGFATEPTKETRVQ